MSSKRWLLTMLGAALLVLGPVAGFNYWADPDGRWATETFPLRDLNEASAFHHRYASWRRHGGEVLIMGSSRVVFLEWPREIDGMRVQVLAFGDATLAQQVAWWPEILARGEVRRIYLGLDFLGAMRGWDERRAWFEEEWGPRMRSLFYYRRTRESWKLATRPDNWHEFIEGVVDLRTGHTVWHRALRSELFDQRSLDFFEQRARQIDSRTAQANTARARSELDHLLAQAEAAGVEVVLFINPVANAYLEMLKATGVMEAVETWKADLVARHGAIDLMQEWPEEMQAWFFDPAHLDFAFSNRVWEALGIKHEVRFEGPGFVRR